MQKFCRRSQTLILALCDAIRPPATRYCTTRWCKSPVTSAVRPERPMRVGPQTAPARRVAALATHLGSVSEAPAPQLALLAGGARWGSSGGPPRRVVGPAGGGIRRAAAPAAAAAAAAAGNGNGNGSSNGNSSSSSSSSINTNKSNTISLLSPYDEGAGGTGGSP